MISIKIEEDGKMRIGWLPMEPDKLDPITGEIISTVEELDWLIVQLADFKYRNSLQPSTNDGHHIYVHAK